MDAKKLNRLLAKKLSGEATAEELQALENYLSSNPDEKYVHDIIAGWWNPAGSHTTDFNSEKEEHFGYILSQAATNNNIDLPVIHTISKKKNIRRFIYWPAAAATLAICFAAWKYSLHPAGKNTAPAANNEIVTQKGTRSKVLLPDGSSVMLNADSKLTYAERFNDSLREVVLDGEAFFDVVKDPSRPFIVHTSAIDIRVVGTAFNIKSYPKEPTIEATLVRGIIEVQSTGRRQASTIILKPNEKLIYKKPGFSPDTADGGIKQNTASSKENTGGKEDISISTLPKVKSDTVRCETSWVYGRLLFEGESFRQLAPAMERWFNVKISFANDNVAAVRFRGLFQNESIQEALEAMKLTAPFSYTITGNNVMIDSKK